MYQKIMVPLDGSELAECVLPHVESLVKAGGVEEVFFVRVVEPSYISSHFSDYAIPEDELKRIEARNKTAAQNYLDQLVSRLDYGKVKLQAEVLNGMVAETLAEYAQKQGVDLIVIATHGRSGISRWVWGSVADRLLRSSRVPVLMVRAPGCAAHA